MFEVERDGHGTRKITKLNLLNILQELIGTSLRTDVGITNDLWIETLERHGKWENIKFCFLQDIILSDQKCQEFMSDGLLDISNGLKMTSKGLILLDHILPYIFISLEKNLSIFLE